MLHRPESQIGSEAKLFDGVEDLSVEKLIPQLRVEVLAVAVLPGRAGFDIQCLCSFVRQLFAQVFWPRTQDPLSERMCSGTPFQTMTLADPRPPNRTCTFRYASGSPGTQIYAGVRIHSLRKRSTQHGEKDCSTLPSRHSLRVGRRRLCSRTSRVLLRRSFLCFFINQRQIQSPT